MISFANTPARGRDIDEALIRLGGVQVDLELRNELRGALIEGVTVREVNDLNRWLMDRSDASRGR